MKVINIHILSGRNIRWFLNESTSGSDGLSVHILCPCHSEREAKEWAVRLLKEDDFEWISPHSRGNWAIDIPRLRSYEGAGTFWEGLEWLTEPVAVEAKFVTEQHLYPPSFYDGMQLTHSRLQSSCYLILEIYKDDYILDKNSKIFLSHKGADKPLVKRYFDTLRLLGFDPWIDDDAMPAGTELHRGILQGFKDSCGAAFFLTPNFKDEAHLKNEINYAIQEKTTKGDRFAIVTLVFDKKGHEIQVPDLLRPFVWKHPKSDLDGLNEIIRALPIQIGPVNWRPGV